MELLITSDHAYTDIVLAEFSLLSRGLQSFETMLDEFLPAKGSKRLIVLLEVSFGRLGASTDCHGEVLVVVARRTCFEQMRACLVN